MGECLDLDGLVGTLELFTFAGFNPLVDNGLQVGGLFALGERDVALLVSSLVQVVVLEDQLLSFQG